MFHRLARYYDLLVGEKDYRAEVQRLGGLAKRYGKSSGSSWLDVGCGTGRHLKGLRRRWRVSGVDLSPEMLRVARRRLPGVRLVRADMRTFELNATFDVVSCLYSAIGHLTSEREVAEAFQNFAHHLTPGGVAIVEPWIDRSEFRSGYVHLLTNRSRSVVVVRMGSSRSRGPYSLIDYHFLIGETGRGVRHYEQTDRGLLVPHRRLLQLMERAGLRARKVRAGLTPGRGLLIGQKPTRAGKPVRSR